MKKNEMKRRYEYSVYDNKSGLPIAIMEKAEKCAELMGVSLAWFYTYAERCKKIKTRWTVIKHDRAERLSICNFKGIDKLPKMIRVARLAATLNVTSRCIIEICEKIKVPVIKAGMLKIKMISRDDFFEKLKADDEQ
jgi:hypothetical protein